MTLRVFWTSALLAFLLFGQTSARPHQASHGNPLYHRRHHRQQTADLSNTCGRVRSPPHHVFKSLQVRDNQKIVGYYKKYTEAYNIPVLASEEVSDEAMMRACYVLRFALAENPTLRNAYYRLFGRVVIIPTNSHLQDIPEFSELKKRRGIRSRSHAATEDIPVTAAGEENVMCDHQDKYHNEDLLLRQIVLGAFNLAVAEYRPDYMHILNDLYESAMRGWIWTNTVASESPEDYLGEAVQIYFDVNGYSNPANGQHNDIYTRWKLMMYDPAICNFVIYFFPCANHYIPRCRKPENVISYQKLRFDCFPPYLEFFDKNVRWTNREPYGYSENG